MSRTIHAENVTHYWQQPVDRIDSLHGYSHWDLTIVKVFCRPLHSETPVAAFVRTSELGRVLFTTEGR